jgi:hypothetical protein
MQPMQALLSSTLIIPSSQATSCEVAGETVILDAASGQYFALNPVGTAVWQHLQTPCTISQLCEKLCAEYEVPLEQCEADVSVLVEQLAAQGLVKLDS